MRIRTPLLLSASALLVVTPAFGQDLKVSCEPAAETLRQLEALPSMRDFSLPFEARLGPLRSLAERNPDDFFVQRYYQDSFRRTFHLADEYDRALALYRKRPSHPLSRYWEARLLMKVEPERSKKTFEELLAADKKFVWPHLDFIEWSELPGQRKPKEVEARLTQFMAVCPESPEAYERARLAGDPQLVQAAADNLRRALERRNSPVYAALWPTLWSLESRTREEVTARSAKIRSDLKRIESWEFRPRPELLWVYRQASELLKDPEVLNTFEARVAREAPESRLLLSLLDQRWHAENPRPGGEPTMEQRKAYEDKRAEAQREWARRWPGACNLVREDWFALHTRWRSADYSATAADLDVVDAMLKCRTESPDLGASWPPMETIVAELYAAAKVRLEEIPRLLDAGLKAVEKQEKYRMSRDLIPKEMQSRLVDNVGLTFERTQQIRADYFIHAGRLKEARGLAEQEIARLDNEKPAPDAAEQERRMFDWRRSDWVRRLAIVAEKEGRVEQALSLYRSSLKVFSKETLTSARNPQVASIKRLYLANGGSEDQWLEWASAGDQPNDNVITRSGPVFSQALPEFSAKDLAGRTWQLKDLKGKSTFVNYWATWCGPCRAEHPEIQKLHDRVKNLTGVQVLTISVDETPVLAEAYMKEKGYTFTVIHGPALADKLLPYAGLPTNFLVNTDGRRTSFYGFWGGEEGLRRTIADLEKGSPKP